MSFVNVVHLILRLLQLLLLRLLILPIPIGQVDFN